MESALRTAVPAHATGAVEFVALEEIAPDETFRLRADGDVALLATSLGRLGQLAPIELRPWPAAASDGPRWQVVAGFRRLAAVRLLARERVLARVHGALSEGDAWSIALTDALLREPLGAEGIDALRARLPAIEGAGWADELLDEALVRAPVATELRERFYEFVRGEGAAATASSTANATSTPASTADATSTSTADADATATPTMEASPADPDILEVTPEELAQDLAARLSQANHDLLVAFAAWGDIPEAGRRAILEQARYIAELMPFLEQPVP